MLSRTFSVLTVALALIAAIAGAGADQYPSRPITIVVPFAAGGPTDTLARIMGQRMSVSLRQNVVIDNLSGAAGSIAVGRVARSTPDGYTLSIGHIGTHVINGAIYSLQYDLLTDLAPISLIASNPQLIIARRDIPARDLKELVAWIKERPGKALVGHAGVGSPSHISGVYLQKAVATPVVMVPFRGSAPALQAMIAGQIDIMVDQASNCLPHVRANAVNAFAVTAKSRSKAAPEIPTVDEAGLPGLYMSVWHGLWAPSGTPPDVIAKLNAAVVETLADPAVQKRLADLGQEIPAVNLQTPQALGAFQKAEIEKWWPVIKAENIKAE